MAFTEVVSRNAKKTLIKPTLTPGIKPLLILLDVDGLMVFRSDKSLPGIHQDTAVLQHNGRYVYIRPHAAALLKYLVTEKDCVLGFYTSMIEKNAVPVVNHLMKSSGLGNYRYLLFDRNYNDPDPQPANAWDTIRNLEKVWAAQHCAWNIPGLDKDGASGAGRFGPENTLLLDDELRKVTRCGSNTLLITPWNLFSHTPETAKADEGLVYARMAMDIMLKMYRKDNDIRKISLSKADLSKLPKIFDAPGVPPSLKSDEKKTVVHVDDTKAWSAISQNSGRLVRTSPVKPSSEPLVTKDAVKDAVREAIAEVRVLSGTQNGQESGVSFDEKIDELHALLEQLRVASSKDVGMNVGMKIIYSLSGLYT